MAISIAALGNHSRITVAKEYVYWAETPWPLRPGEVESGCEDHMGGWDLWSWLVKLPPSSLAEFIQRPFRDICDRMDVFKESGTVSGGKSRSGGGMYGARGGGSPRRGTCGGEPYAEKTRRSLFALCLPPFTETINCRSMRGWTRVWCVALRVRPDSLEACHASDSLKRRRETIDVIFI